MFLQVIFNFITRISCLFNFCLLVIMSTQNMQHYIRFIQKNYIALLLSAHFLEIANLNLLSLVILLNLPNQQTHTGIKKPN